MAAFVYAHGFLPLRGWRHYHNDDDDDGWHRRIEPHEKLFDDGLLSFGAECRRNLVDCAFLFCVGNGSLGEYHYSTNTAVVQQPGDARFFV